LKKLGSTQGIKGTSLPDALFGQLRWSFFANPSLKAKGLAKSYGVYFNV